jgi:hypothetical protein
MDAGQGLPHQHVHDLLGSLFRALFDLSFALGLLLL